MSSTLTRRFAKQSQACHGQATEATAGRPNLFTVPVGLATVNASYGALYAQVMALAVLGALPLLVAFLLFQRQIVQGIANTGLKG